MNPLSCFCESCLKEEYDKCTSKGKKRPADDIITMVKKDFQRRSHEEGWQEFFKRGVKVVENPRYKVGRYVIVYVPSKWRHTGCLQMKDVKCTGRYMIAQIAEVPTSTKRSGTKSRPKKEAMLKLFLPVEEEMELKYSFASQDICRDNEGGLVERGKCKRKGCISKHYDLVQYDHIRHGPIEQCELMDANRDDIICVDSDEESDEEGVEGVDDSPNASEATRRIDLIIRTGMKQMVEQQWRNDELMYSNLFLDDHHAPEDLDLAGRQPRKRRKGT